MPPEVLIYVQNVKKYLETNQEARNYFLDGLDVDLFFKHLTEISEKNFKKNGEVMLDKEQFELLKKTLKAIEATKLPEIKTEEEPNHEKIFFDLGNLGKICLN